jgi:hypothetical protein
MLPVREIPGGCSRAAGIAHTRANADLAVADLRSALASDAWRSLIRLDIGRLTNSKSSSFTGLKRGMNISSLH